MKRNEMIASLRGYLIDYKRDHPNIKFNADDLAHFVLACVERKGMTPPSREMECGCCFSDEWEGEE